MPKLLISLLFFLYISVSLFAQDTYLAFIDEDKKEFFRNNDWELYYSNDDIKFYDFLIFKGNLVIADGEDFDYNIHFLNESRLIEKSKSINGNNHAPGLPKLYIDQENIAFAPMQKFECIIIPEKERVKKKNRLKNWRKRNQGEYFKKYLHYRDYTFYSFASLNDETGFQEVEIQYGKDEKNLSTLYVAKIKTDYLSYSDNADRVEVVFLDDRILLIDNFSHQFLVFDFEGNKHSETNLSQFKDRNTTTYLSDALLRKDPVNNEMYLVFQKDIYEIALEANKFEFEKIKLDGGLMLYKARIYDSHLYHLFSLGKDKGRAIYRKKLE
ncbi:hypothetical protein [Marivirga sp.]|uniref:hypothetical protein n=1 Tax=Marivirga sp. TaxID=2018662 RepID=UPI0025F293A2|nr:hypothetical protein [Marivirga sp.]